MMVALIIDNVAWLHCLHKLNGQPNWQAFNFIPWTCRPTNRLGYSHQQHLFINIILAG